MDFISKCPEAKDFMRVCFPKELKFFSFNYDSGEDLNMDDYTGSMLSILQSVTDEVYLWRSHMKSSSAINNIIKACHNCERIMFRNSEMFADEECDFTLGQTGSKYKTNFIHFSNSSSNVENWSSNPERFENIVKGISKSSLAKSLETLVVGSTKFCLGEDKAKEVLSKHHLSSIKVKVKCFERNKI